MQILTKINIFFTPVPSLFFQKIENSIQHVFALQYFLARQVFYLIHRILHIARSNIVYG